MMVIIFPSLNCRAQPRADIHLDTPPLRCVIVDPYTGYVYGDM